MYILPFAVYFCLILGFRNDTQLVGVRQVWCLLLAPSQTVHSVPSPLFHPGFVSLLETGWG